MVSYMRKGGRVIAFLMVISAVLFIVYNINLEGFIDVKETASTLLSNNLNGFFDIKEISFTKSVISAYVNLELNLVKGPWLSAPQLPRALTKAEHDEAIQLLKDFSGILSVSNMTFLMSYGTLLGSFMAHDILPWDDDLDLAISCSDLPKLRKIVESEEVGKTFGFSRVSFLKDFPHEENDTVKFQFIKKHKSLMKFYRRSNPKAPGDRTWTFPYIDIDCYSENQTHVNILDKNILEFKKSEFYPFHYRPL